MAISKRSDVNPDRGTTEYGDVKFADPVNNKYPIDTEEHVRAALAYFGMPKNRAKYSSTEQDAILGRIHAAAKKFGITVSAMAEGDFEAEVFETGEWGGRSWAEADLDAMVSNFSKLDGKVRPPVQLGHDAKIAQHDGSPAMGWVTGLRRDGSKLLATLSQVPGLVKDAIRQGLYRTVSSGIYPAWQKTSWEKNLRSGAVGPALAHVALLGAKAPEVKTLADLAAYLHGETGDGGDAMVLAFAEPALMDESGGAAAQPERVARDASAAVSPIRHQEGWTCPNCGAGVAPDQKTCPTCSGGMGSMNGMGMRERALPATAHPRIQGVARTGTEERRMTADDRQALLAEFDAQLASLKDEVTKLAESKQATETKLVKLAEENAQMRARESALEARALENEALTFVESRCQKANLRVFPSQKSAALALYRRLDGTQPIVAAAEAQAFGLKREADYTARDLFTEFVDLHPHSPIVAAEVARATKPEASNDLEAVLAETAAKHNLDLAKHSEKVRALEIVGREHPELTKVRAA